MLGREGGSSHLQYPPALKEAAPSSSLSALLHQGGSWAGTAPLCCSTFLSVNVALPTGHALEQMDTPGVHNRAGRCPQESWA